MLSEERLAGYLAGALPATEREELEAALPGDAEALAEVVAQLQMDASLQALLAPAAESQVDAILAVVRGSSNAELEAQVLADTVEAAPVFMPGWKRFPVWLREQFSWRAVSWAGAALVVFIAAALAWQWTAGRLPVIGTVRQVAGAEWAGRSHPPQAGDALVAGPLRLEAGLLELELGAGAVVTVQGPARLELSGRNAVKLIEGRLAATVPQSAHGFAVQMTNATLVDLGTRFGAWAQADGAVEADVFEGRVSLAPTDAPAQELKRGQAMVVNRDGTTSVLAALPGLFPQAGGELLVHPKDCGFESRGALPADGIPSVFDQWSGTGGVISGPRDGIRPHAYNLMLRFARPSAHSSGAAEMWQLVNLASQRAAFADGPVSVTWSAMFNRVAGGTDRFGVVLAAFRGQPADAPELAARLPRGALAFAEAEQRLDADPATWEKVAATATVPAEADFLLVGLRALPSRPASGKGDPFPGHFADTALLTFQLPPKPAAQAARR